VISKRTLLASMGALVCVGTGPALAKLPAIPAAQHEKAMRLAIEEGPHKPDVRKKALARVQKLKEEIAAAAAEPVKPKGEMTADKIDRLRLQCARDLNDILGGGGYKDFDERVQRILGQVLMLHNPDRPLTSGFLVDTLADLSLTPEQKAKIDQLLKERVDKLKQADQASAGQPTSIQRMRQDEVAFATRAAIRQTLTPKQLQVWDQGV